jgi:hypothetical protein
MMESEGIRSQSDQLEKNEIKGENKINNFMESRRHVTGLIKQEASKVISSLNRAIRKLESGKLEKLLRDSDGELKPRRSTIRSRMLSSDNSYSRESNNLSSNSHQRWMTKLNEFSARRNSGVKLSSPGILVGHVIGKEGYQKLGKLIGNICEPRKKAEYHSKDRDISCNREF